MSDEPLVKARSVTFMKISCIDSIIFIFNQKQLFFAFNFPNNSG